jgi:hypothetical protein
MVHACKSPCHRRAVGYQGSLPPEHPHDLMRWHDYDLYLNLIDPPTPLFQVPSSTHCESFAPNQSFVGTAPMAVVQLVKALLAAPVVGSQRDRPDTSWRSTPVTADG